MENDSLFPAPLSDPGDILNDANLIVDIHHGDQNRVRSTCCDKHIPVDQSVVFDIEIGYLEPLALEFSAGIQRCLVLGANGNNVSALFFIEMGSPFHRQVDRLRSP